MYYGKHDDDDDGSLPCLLLLISVPKTWPGKCLWNSAQFITWLWKCIYHGKHDDDDENDAWW